MHTHRAGHRDSYHHGDLREALLQRAAEVIEEEGIEALTLRGLARDLGVSHAAPNRHFRNKADLLASLATQGYAALRHATLKAAEEAGEDPRVRLNAMGQGFLHWALDNPARFRAITHPDVERYADAALLDAMAEFGDTVREAIAAAQRAGRHPGVDLEVLELYTNAVPFGAAMMLAQPVFSRSLGDVDQAGFVAELIELVAPIADGSSASREEDAR